MTGEQLLGIKEITLNDGNTYKIQFTVNSMIELQKTKGGLAKIFDFGDEIDFEALRYFLHLGLKKHHKNLTEEDVGDLIDLQQIGTIMGKLFEGFRLANPIDEKGQMVEEEVPDEVLTRIEKAKKKD